MTQLGGAYERPHYRTSEREGVRRFLNCAAQLEPELLSDLLECPLHAFQAAHPELRALAVSDLLQHKLEGSAPPAYPKEVREEIRQEDAERAAEALWEWAGEYNVRGVLVFSTAIETLERACTGAEPAGFVPAGPDIATGAPDLRTQHHAWRGDREEETDFAARARLDFERQLKAYMEELRQRWEVEGWVAVPEKRDTNRKDAQERGGSDRHFKWFARNRVQQWSIAKIGREYKTDHRAVSKALHDVSQLVDLPVHRGRPGRRRSVTAS